MEWTTEEWVTLIESCPNPNFLAILREVLSMHNRKSHDYATLEDPLQNVRTAEEYDLPAWIGVQIRLDDKRNRIKGAIKKILKGKPVVMSNESLRDSFVDRIVYSIIALQLLDETMESEDKQVGKLPADICEALKGDAPVSCACGPAIGDTKRLENAEF